MKNKWKILISIILWLIEYIRRLILFLAAVESAFDYISWAAFLGRKINHLCTATGWLCSPLDAQLIVAAEMKIWANCKIWATNGIRAWLLDNLASTAKISGCIKGTQTWLDLDFRFDLQAARARIRRRSPKVLKEVILRFWF